MTLGTAAVGRTVSRAGGPCAAARAVLLAAAAVLAAGPLWQWLAQN